LSYGGDDPIIPHCTLAGERPWPYRLPIAD